MADNSFIVDLKCFSCRREFRVKDVSFEDLSDQPYKTPCAHCNAIGGDVSRLERMHQVVHIQKS